MFEMNEFWMDSQWMIEQKSMTFNHDVCYSFPLFSSLLNTEGRRKGEWIAKIMIKSHAFLPDLFNALTRLWDKWDQLMSQLSLSLEHHICCSSFLIIKHSYKDKYQSNISWKPFCQAKYFDIYLNTLLNVYRRYLEVGKRGAHTFLDTWLFYKTLTHSRGDRSMYCYCPTAHLDF